MDGAVSICNTWGVSTLHLLVNFECQVPIFCSMFTQFSFKKRDIRTFGFVTGQRQQAKG